MTWKKMSPSAIGEEIIGPLQALVSQWTAFANEVITAGMPDAYVTFAKVHEDALVTLRSCHRETTATLDNQITAFRRGDKSDIEKNQLRNEKQRLRRMSEQSPTVKVPSKRVAKKKPK